MIEINNCIKQLKLDFIPKIAFNKLLIAANDLLMVHEDRLIVVNFIDEQEIQSINKKCRQIDHVTDVLSFSFDEAGTKGIVLGEIYICITQAIKQAEAYHHSIKREICFLFVHGLLHLYGYDHQTEEQANKMFTCQDKILSKCEILRRF